MHTKTKLRWLELALVSVFGLIPVLAVNEPSGGGNPCGGTTCGVWTCNYTGSVSNTGASSWTNLTIGTDYPINPPTITGVTFNNGQKTRTCSNGCGNWNEANAVAYGATNWWSPPIPSVFTNVGTFSFTNQVRGNSIDGNCNNPTAATNGGVITITVTNTALAIFTHPSCQSIAVGAPVTYTVRAGGAPPLSYQWMFNGVNIAGATNASFTINSVHPSYAGEYSVLVSNVYGSRLSSNACLNIFFCVTAPTNLISWWRAEGNALDSKGANHGILRNGVGFTNDHGVQAFSFNGSNAVEIPLSATLNSSAITNYSIEAWIKPTAQADNLERQGAIFSQPYGLGSLMTRNGSNGVRAILVLSEWLSGGIVVSSNEMPLGVFSHVVGTAGNGKLRIYINGVFQGETIPGINPVMDPNVKWNIGGHWSQSGGNQYFKGVIDDVSFYNRALSSEEIAALYNANAANKCIGTNVSCGTINCGAWDCTRSGSVTSLGSLSWTNLTIGPGNTINPPAVTGIALGVGEKSRVCSNSCLVWTNYAPVYYNVSNWWSPGIPTTLSNFGIFSFTNKIQGISTDGDCMTSTPVTSGGIITITVTGGPPVIVSQPNSQVILSFQLASFRVEATGSQPLSYHWRYKGNDFTGATNSVLSFLPDYPYGGGSYSVVVSNSVGSVTSSPAVLTIQVASYLTLGAQTYSNFTFKSDTTYFVTSNTILKGTTIFEGGAVIKHDGYGMLSLYGDVVCKTGPYRPIIFTAKGDDSVGAPIDGSMGISGHGSVGTYLKLISVTNPVLCNMRFSHAALAVEDTYGISTPSSMLTVRDCQFNNGNGAIKCGKLKVQNTVMNMYQYGSYNAIDANSDRVIAENVTADRTYHFILARSSCNISLTNCLLLSRGEAVATANSGDVITLLTNSVVMLGTNSVFQPVGAGSYYLTNNSPFRNVGTTNISPELLVALRKKTTFPPILFSNVTFSVSTNLSPQALRDTDNIDLGYHYDPIDFFCTSNRITNCTLTLTNGVVVAYDNTSGGLRLASGSSIVSRGTPLAPNWVVHYATAQEQPKDIGLRSYTFAIGIRPDIYSRPSGFYSYTYFVTPGSGGATQTGSPFLHSGVNIYGELTFENCQLWGGIAAFSGNSFTHATVNNNLFHRGILSITHPVSFATNYIGFSNNLVVGAYVQIFSYNDRLRAYNNAFDSCAFSTSQCTNGHNAYINCGEPRIQPVFGGDIVLNSLAWQRGPLGDFYQPINSPLINAGSVSDAGLVGLGDYTTQTNQTPEANSVLDIGLHYPALIRIISSPSDSTVCAGSAVEFDVATGGANVQYQWQKDGIDIIGATSSNYVINPALPRASGAYQCVASGPFNSIVTPPATLTALGILNLLGPNNLTNCVGTTAIFQSTAVGSGPFTFQWRKGGNLLAGQSSNILVIADVNASHAGTYSVAVSGACGPGITNSATLTVGAYDVTASDLVNQTVCAGSPASFTVTAGGTGPFTYVWKYNGNVLTGRTGNTLTIINVGATNTGSYSVTVYGQCGSVTKSTTLNLTVPITAQPQAQTVTYGVSASFSVTTSVVSPTYQWRKNGANIAGATSSTYPISKPPVSDSGSIYDVVISGSGCSAISQGAVLTVNRKPVTVQADNKSKLYGANNPSLTYTVISSGFVSGENASVLSGSPGVATAATSGSPIGQHAITITTQTLYAANYSFNLVNGSLTISQTNLTVTADNKAKLVGDAVPALTGNITGLQNSDPITGTYSTSATAGSSAGNYPIIPALVDPSARLGNYNVTTNNGTLTNVPPPMSINASSAGITYIFGQPPLPLDQTATISVAGGFTYNGSKIKAGFKQGRSFDQLIIRECGSRTNTSGPVDQIRIGDQPNGNGSWNITNNTTLIGSYVGGTPQTPLVVTFNSAANQQRMQAVITNLSYINTATNPVEGQSIIDVAVYDSSDSTASAKATYTVDGTCPSAMDVILIIDRTKSMETDNKLAQARSAAVKFLDYMQFSAQADSDKVKIITFAGDPNPDWPLSANPGGIYSPSALASSAFLTDKTAATTYINNVTTMTNCTVYHPVLNLAHDAMAGADPNRLQLIIFLTDGKIEPQAGIQANHDIVKAIYTADAIGAAVNIKNKKIGLVTIGFGTGIDAAGQELLKKLASAETDCLLAPGGTELNAKYAEIASRICRNRLHLSIASANYLENSPPLLLDQNFEVKDPATINYNGHVLTVDLNPNNLTEDHLNIRNEGTGTGQINLNGSSVKYGSTTIGTYTGSDTRTLTITLNSSATPAAVQALMRNITYHNTSENPATTLRKVTARITDGGTAGTAPASMDLTVTRVNDQPTLDAITDKLVSWSAGGQSVNLTGIAPGGGESQSLTITATSDNPALVPNPSVTYTSPNASGTLLIAPTWLAFGTATITVTVTDDGGTANGGVNQFSRTFLVTLNDTAPTVSFAASSLSYIEMNPPAIVDAGFQISDPDSPDFNQGQLTVDFGSTGQPGDRLGIRNEGTGAGQISVVEVFGSDNVYTLNYVPSGGSGNPVPIGTFTAPEALQPLIVTFNPNASVTAVRAAMRNVTFYNGSCNPSTVSRTLRVVLSDGDGKTSTPATLQINFTAVNNAPTLNQITGLTIAKNAGLQTVNLSGIMAGCDESQVLSVTAVSANTAVIPNPTVVYSSPNTVSALSFTPVANAVGSADITVTVQDNGGTANGGVNQASRVFTVTVTAPVGAPPAFNLGNPVTFLIGDPPLIMASSATFNDADQSNPNTFNYNTIITLRVAKNADEDDRLAVNHQGTGTGQIGITAGGVISYGGQNFGQTSGTGLANTPLTITINNGSINAVQALLRNLTFVNALDNPSRVDRTIQVTIRESSGSTDVLSANKLVHVQARNRAPIVDAGLDQTIVKPTGSAVAQLAGFVADDDLPVGNAVTISWTCIDKPAGSTVTFTDTASPPTKATFSAIGNYVLQLTASDGTASINDTVTIHVADKARRPKDVMLLIETASRTYNFNAMTDVAWQRASQFVDYLSLDIDQVGLMTYSASTIATPQVFLMHSFSHDPDSVHKSGFAGSYENNGIGTYVGNGIHGAIAELTGARHNPEAEKVLIIFFNFPGWWLHQDNYPFEFPIFAANEAKAAGIQVITVGLYAGYWGDPHPEVEAAMQKMSSDPTQDHFYIMDDNYQLELTPAVQTKLKSIATRLYNSPGPNQYDIKVDAGENLTIPRPANGTVTFPLSGHAESSHLPITYSWEQMTGWGWGPAQISSANTATPTVTIQNVPEPADFYIYTQPALLPTYFFRLTATDAEGNVGNSYVTVTISTRPVPDSFTVAKGSRENVLDVLRNDPNSSQYQIHGVGIGATLHVGTTETAQGVEPFTESLVSISPDRRKLIYTPCPTYDGMLEVFSYDLQDLAGNPIPNSEVFVFLWIEPVNEPPTARDYSVAFAPNSGLHGFAADEVWPWSDPNFAEYKAFSPRVISVTQPANGLGQSGIDNYTPFELDFGFPIPEAYRPHPYKNYDPISYEPWYIAPSVKGTTEFTYVVADSYGLMATGKVNVLITDDPAILGWKAVDDYAEAFPGGSPVTINVLANDVNQPNTIFSVTQPSAGGGSVTIDTSQNPHRLIYTPPAVVPSTPVEFSYKIFDGTQPEASAIVHVGVHPPITYTAFADITNLEPDAGDVDTHWYKLVNQGLLEVQGVAENVLDPSIVGLYFLHLVDAQNNEVINQEYHVQVHPPGGALGTLDLTYLKEGLYEVQLEVIGDLGSDTAYRYIYVSHGNGMKPGRFTLSVRDLEIPLAGLPISLDRTYDSTDETEEDFGTGWKLGVNGAKLTSSLPLGADWHGDQHGFQYCLRDNGPHIVTISFADGKEYRFRAVANVNGNGSCAASIGGSGVLVGLNFVPLNGTPPGNTLVAPEAVQLEPNPESDKMGDVNLYSDDGVDYTLFDTTTFVFTRADGKVFHFEGGKTTSVEDQNNYRLTFDDSGVHHWQKTGGSYVLTGKGVKIVRDAQHQNRITEIYGPDALDSSENIIGPPTLVYQYENVFGPSGSLLMAVKRLVEKSDPNKPVYQSATYRYSPVGQPPRNILTTMGNAQGVVRNEYDPVGRLIATIDAMGNRTTFNHTNNTPPFHSPAAKARQIITTPAKTTVIHEYDEKGNIVATEDALHHVTYRSFDAFNNKTMETDPLGHITKYDYTYVPGSDVISVLTVTMPHDPALPDSDFQTVSAYDLAGQLTSYRDANGHSSAFVYVTAADVQADPNNYVNAVGKIKQTTDANQKVTTFKYPADTVIAEDAVGNITETHMDAFGYVVLDIKKKNTGTQIITLEQTAKTYDANGNLQTKTEKRTLPDNTYEEIVTTYSNDAANRVRGAQVTKQHFSAAGVPIDANPVAVPVPTTTIAFDDAGQIKSESQVRILPDGTFQTLTTSYIYDANGRPVRLDYPDGTFEETTYDNMGLPVSIRDRAGRTTEFKHDEAGRVIETRYPDGTRVTTEYDTAGRVIARRDALGLKTSYEYDAAGRQTKVKTSDLKVFEYQYDAIGNLRFAKDSQGRTTEYRYDNVNRCTKVIYPDLTEQNTVYDDVGRKIQTTDQANIVTKYIYDDRGNLGSVINAYGTADATTTQYQYDEAHNLLKQTDAEGRETKYEYDTLGRRTKRILPGLEAELYTYDELGLLKTRRDFNGKTTTFEYDAAGRLLKKIPDSNFGIDPVLYTYTATGQRASMTYPLGTGLGSETVTYQYQGNGRLWKKISPQGTITYTYDANANVASMATSHGTTVGYQWDSLNRLSKVTDNSSGTPQVTGYEYDDVGNLQTISYPNAATTRFTYSSLNRLADMSVTLGANTLAGFNYNPADRPLGAAGNRRAAVESINASQGVSRRVNYYYDNLYRLTKEELVTGAQTGTVVYDTTSGYADTDGYDKVGNRRKRTVTLTPAISGYATKTYSYDVDDRLDTDTNPNNANPNYDANGNTLIGEVLPTQTTADEYDYANRLTARHTTIGGQSATIRLVYDGDGRRVRKTITQTSTTTVRDYLVDSLNPSGYAQVVEEMVSVNGASATLDRAYVYGNNLISQRQGNGTVSYYGYDGHANVRFLMDNNAQITDTYTYDAFGLLIEQWHLGTATPNNYLYSGEQFDLDLGLYYLRARYLNPATGRFWTMDTYEGTQSDPFSLHKYLYANADPVNNIDPSGHESLAGVSIACTIGASLDAIYNGVVSGVGVAMRMTILGVQAGKSANDILAEYVLDQTGIQDVLDIAQAGADAFAAVKSFLLDHGADEEQAAMMEFIVQFDGLLLPMLTGDVSALEGFNETFTDAQCLVGGTLVETTNGLKEIEAIRQGDWVWAWNSETGEREARRVLNTFSRIRDEILEIQIDEDITVIATAEHPFYLQDGTWKKAGDLFAGEVLFDESNPMGRLVTGITRKQTACTVYNMEVEGLHNYFITGEGILTHNGKAYNHYFMRSFQKAISVQRALGYGERILGAQRWLGNKAHTKYHKQLNAFLEKRKLSNGKSWRPASNNSSKKIFEELAKKGGAKQAEQELIEAFRDFHANVWDGGKKLDVFNNEVKAFQSGAKTAQ